MNTPPSALPPQFTPKDIRAVMAGLLLAMFLDGLDQTIVATSLSTMARDLDGWESMSWVVTAYLLSSIAVTPIYGRLSDLYGRRPVLLVAIVIFMLSSVVCALAYNMPQLILGRFLQGIGGGGLRSVSLVVIADMIPPRDRGRYQALLSSSNVASTIFGPVLGGFMSEYLSWHWIFWINIPLAILAFARCNKQLKRLQRPKGQSRVDWVGAVLIVAAAMPITFALGRAEQVGGWGNIEIFAAIAGGLVAAMALVAWEAITVDPMMPLRLFANRTFTLMLISTFFANMIYFALIVTIPMAYQLNGYSINQSGFGLIPYTLGDICSSMLSGWLVSHLGRTRIFPLIGCTAMAVACAFMAIFGLGHSTGIDLCVTLMLGFSTGIMFNPATVMVLNVLPMEDNGIGMATQVFFRRLGGVFGVAFFISLLTGDLNFGVLAVPGHEVLGANPGVAMLHLDHALDPALQSALAVTIHDAFTKLFLVAMTLALLALVAAFYVRETPLRSHADRLRASASPGEAKD